MSVEHIEPFGDLLHAEIHIQVDVGLHRGTAAFGRDDDDAVGTACTVDSCRRSIFQYVNRSNVIGIDRCEWIVGILSASCRGSRHLAFIHVDLHAVDDIERRRTSIERIGTANGNIHAGASFPRLCRNTHTGHAALQRRGKIGGTGLHQLVRTHGSHRPCQILTRYSTITDDHHLIDRANLFLQSDIIMRFLGLDIDLGSLIADKPDLQCSCIHPLDRESSAGVGRSARLCPGNDDCRPDHRAAVLVNDRTRNLRSSRLLLSRHHGAQQRNEQPCNDEKQYIYRLFHKFPNISSF